MSLGISDICHDNMPSMGLAWRDRITTGVCGVADPPAKSKSRHTITEPDQIKSREAIGILADLTH